MKARAHALTGAVGWLLIADTAAALGHPMPLLGEATGTVSAAGWAIWNDLDCQATAARSLGWPSRALAAGIARAAHGHREATHWAVTTAALASVAWLASEVPWAAFVVLGLGVAWVQAALATANGRRKLRIPWFAPLLWPRAVFRIAVAFLLMRRVHPNIRLIGALLAALAVVAFDPTPAWLPGTVLVGGWAHLLGDMMTTRRFAVLAPFVRREFGGWRVIPPTKPGQRVTRAEYLIEMGLAVAGIAAAAYLAEGITAP